MPCCSATMGGLLRRSKAVRYRGFASLLRGLPCRSGVGPIVRPGLCSSRDCPGRSSRGLLLPEEFRRTMSPLRSLIFGLMAAVAAAPAAAQTAPAAANTTVLHLSETAQREVPRDRLRVELAAQAVDANASKVQAEINRRMAAALARIKSAQGIAVETQGYSVYPERSDKGPTRWHGGQ